MFKNRYKKQIEEQMIEFKLYLENNYKDLAIQARKDTMGLVESFYEQGKINQKAYNSYIDILNDYTEQMKEYNHQQFYRS
ncbi:MAG: hypothetical protein ACRC1P_10190 [Cellulosilyticaceae bacterium]